MQRHLSAALALLFAFVLFAFCFIGCENDETGGGIVINIDSGGIDVAPTDAGTDNVLVPSDSGLPTSFDVTGVSATSSTGVQVTFSDPPNAIQAVKIENYAIPGLTLSGTPTQKGNVVSITTSPQSAQSYTMTVSNVTRGADGRALTGATGTFAGRAPFSVASAQSESAISFSVTFDAAPNPTQATNLANYAVPGLTLVGAPTLQGNTVTIVTTTQGSQTYTVTVGDVTRASDGEPLTIKSKTFAGTTSFNVASAAATSNKTIAVTFDAPPNAAQATTLANYAVPGLTLSGTPQLNGSVVTITTSTQAAQTYTLTVSNVTRASDGEPLATKVRTFAGRTSFNVASAASTTTNTITVTFDSPPNNGQATTIGNYTVNGLNLTGTPVLAGNTVTITTDNQAAQQYTVVVANVTRAADGEPLTNTSANFNGRAPFNVANAQPGSSLSVSITFDAPPNSAQATTLGNYDIPGLNLSGTPVLVGSTVTITTTRQLAQSYTVTVSGVTRTSDGEALKVKTATFTGKPRAGLLISEVAPVNSANDGSDFVEIVATTAGDIEGLTLRQVSGTIYTFAALDLAIGDRIVVNLTGLPGPTGFIQEDVTKNAAQSAAPFATAAYDVYSNNTGVPATDNVIAILDGATPLDVVAYSDRQGDAAAAAMTAYALARTQTMWAFTNAPVDGANDCATQAEAVSIATTTSVCGGFDTGIATTFSINRIGTTDTNARADWYVAGSTRGLANASIPAPGVVSAVATSATSVDVTFNRELAPASVTAGAFSMTPALNVTVATAASANRVTLTTAAQTAPAYVVTVANTVTTINGSPYTSPSTARFCAFAAQPALLRINEIKPDIPAGADLIELLVTQGGPLAGYQVRMNPTTNVGASGTLVATLPAICSVAGDIVVVHLTPGVNDAPTSETLSITENANSTYSANYDTAYDVRGGNNDPPATNAVIAVRDTTKFIDAVPFTNDDGAGGGTAPTQTVVDSLIFIQGAGLWLPSTCLDPNGGPAPCTITNATGVMASWANVGFSSTTSMQRFNAATQSSSWFVNTPSSFGAPNVLPQ